MRHWLLFLTVGVACAEVDPLEIVRRSVAVDDRSWQLARNYTYVQRDVFRELDGKGKVTNTRVRIRDVLYIGHRPYRRLLEKDGHPLTPDEEKKEQRKLDRAVAERSRENEAERAKQVAEYEKRRARDRENLKQIPEAFDFKLLREEALASGPAYVVEAKPRPGYSGKNHGFLSKVQGTFWINKSDYHWVKVEAEALDTISYGFFVARLAKGSHLTFEQARVNDEIWLPKAVLVTASARLGLIKKLNAQQETTWSKYRKFQTDSRVTSAGEPEQK